MAREMEPLSADAFRDKVLLDGRFVRDSIEDPDEVAGRLGVALLPGAADEVRSGGVAALMKRPPPHGVISRCGAWIFEGKEWLKPEDSGSGPDA